MSHTLPLPHAAKRPGAARLFKAATAFWFVTTVIGQLAFVAFIASFYGASTLTGQFELWNRKDLITGYVAGDTAGNLQFAAHVLLAALIVLSGLIQLVPQLRTHAPQLHRWNGRLFAALSATMAIGGLALVWLRGTYLTLPGAISISLLAVLMLLATVQAVRHARARRFVLHRRWALRLFLLSSGVWFQRVGYMAWIILNGGPAGIGPRMDGPFDLAWGFGQFLLPLAMLEFHLWSERRGPSARLAAALTLTALTLVMAVGIAGTIAIMWWRWL